MYLSGEKVDFPARYIIMARKNPGTAQLEAAVATWSKRVSRRNPNIFEEVEKFKREGVPPYKAPQFLEYARKMDVKYDTYIAPRWGNKASRYETCVEAAQDIIHPHVTQTTNRKPWPMDALEALYFDYLQGIGEGHLVRDDVEHGEKSVYSKHRQNPAKLVARTKVMSKAAHDRRRTGVMHEDKAVLRRLEAGRAMPIPRGLVEWAKSLDREYGAPRFYETHEQAARRIAQPDRPVQAGRRKWPAQDLEQLLGAYEEKQAGYSGMWVLEVLDGLERAGMHKQATRSERKAMNMPEDSHELSQADWNSMRGYTSQYGYSSGD